MATINERLRDEAIAHSLFQSRYATGVARKMVKVLNESDAELSARLIVALDEVNPNSVTVKRLEGLLVSVRQVNKQAVDAMYSSLADELLDFAKHEAGYQLSLFDSLLPGPVLNRFPLAAITQEQVYSAAMAQPFQGRLLRDWAENIEADRMTRIINTVKNGYLAGDTVEQMARKVRGTRARNYQDGVIEAGRKNATAVVKTAVTHLAAVARDKFADNNSNITAFACMKLMVLSLMGHCCVSMPIHYPIPQKRLRRPVATKPNYQLNLSGGREKSIQHGRYRLKALRCPVMDRVRSQSYR
ncbi:phage protein [Yersinia intermedia]|nr:phage protein [Yersinia intermedia]